MFRIKRLTTTLPLTILLTFLLVSCIPTPSTSINLGPDLSVPSTIALDFVELHNDTIEGFGDIIDSPYTFVTDLIVDGSNANELITINATLVSGADSEDAEHFAAALLRHIGEAASGQYPHLKMGNSEEFGNVFDTYSVSIDMESTDGQEIYSLSVPAGEEIPLDPDIESYEEEWRDYAELYIAGQEDADAAWLDEVIANENQE